MTTRKKARGPLGSSTSKCLVTQSFKKWLNLCNLLTCSASGLWSISQQTERKVPQICPIGEGLIFSQKLGGPSASTQYSPLILVTHSNKDRWLSNIHLLLFRIIMNVCYAGLYTRGLLAARTINHLQSTRYLLFLWLTRISFHVFVVWSDKVRSWLLFTKSELCREQGEMQQHERPDKLRSRDNEKQMWLYCS